MISLQLLVVLLISIAPKLYFHDLVAHHKDRASCYQTHTHTVLHQQGNNCHFDDLVVTAPFVTCCEPSLSFGRAYGREVHASLLTEVFQFFVLHRESRGPPKA